MTDHLLIALHLPTTAIPIIRPCSPDDRAAILAVVNAAAERYRGAIPPDCWHEPYMTPEQLTRDLAAGVTFWGYAEEDGELVGVMGTQPVRDVTLVRHAYVRPDQQGRGVGGRLLAHLESLTTRQVLIGTWADSVYSCVSRRAPRSSAPSAQHDDRDHSRLRFLNTASLIRSPRSGPMVTFDPRKVFLISTRWPRP